MSQYLLKDTVTGDCLWFCGLFGVGVFGVFFVLFLHSLLCV